MQRKTSILFVDDNNDIRQLALISLGRLGYEVTTATDGLDAMEQLARRDFDAAVVDMVMPGKEGVATIMEMKENRPAMPIVAISGGGHVSAADMSKLGAIVGADRSLGKPFSPARLHDLLVELTQPGPAAEPRRAGAGA